MTRVEARLSHDDLETTQVGDIQAEPLGDGLLIRGIAEDLTDSGDIVHDVNILATKRLTWSNDDWIE
jgi:hypothetical protein